jgi:DNA-binding FadR family transcriptional regulator
MEIDLEGYRRNQRYLAFLANGFLASQLLRVLHAFDGDLLAAVVLGEIAQHNVQGLVRDRQFRPGEHLEQVLGDLRRRAQVLRPCNALSVSEATGIPRETVRRRIESLVAQGWVLRSRRGYLYVTDALVERLAHFHLETARTVMETADSVRQVLGTRAADTRHATGTGTSVR